MNRNDCPCYKDGKDCPKRTSACHGTCPEYKEFHDKNTAEREAIRKKKAAEALVNETHFKSMERLGFKQTQSAKKE